MIAVSLRTARFKMKSDLNLSDSLQVLSNPGDELARKKRKVDCSQKLLDSGRYRKRRRTIATDVVKG